MTTRYFTKELAGELPNIFAVQNPFMRTFGGRLQVKDGVKDSDNFLLLKTTDADVVIQDYVTDEDVAFEAGTENSNRFGPRREIKAVETQVKYRDPLAIHEGVDNVTVNEVAATVVAERLKLGALAWSEKLKGLLAATLSAEASATLNGELTEEGVSAVFAEARKTFLNNKINTRLARVAYVTPDVYDILLTSGLTTIKKNSDTNIDNGEVRRFKGFDIVEVEDDNFVGDEQIYFAVDNVGIAGIGLSMARAIDAHDFHGTAIQSLAKYGLYLPEKNKKGVLKAALTGGSAGGGVEG